MLKNKAKRHKKTVTSTPSDYMAEFTLDYMKD